MRDNEKNGRGIPMPVRVRAYIRHAVISLISLAAYVLLFAFVSEDSVRALSEIKRFEVSEHNEIVFAAEPNGESTFLYLKNYSVSGEAQKNALSDILMTMEGRTYSSDLCFEGSLDRGTCAVSANISARYGLNVGDTAKVMNTDKTFTVSKILPAQSGIDEEYMHEGIVILAYDEELLGRAYSYVSFTTDGDGYRSLDRLVFTEDIIADAKKTLILLLCVSALSVGTVAAVCEIFLFRQRREDYVTLASFGVPMARLLLRSFAEGCLKYLLPSLIAAAIFSARLGCYGKLYLGAVSCLCALCLLSALILAVIYVRRSYYVRAK